MARPQLLICGFGSAGASVAKAFVRRGILSQDIAVIDVLASKANAARETGHRSVCADATDLHGLRVAEAGAAPSIIICVNDATALAVLGAVRSVSPAAIVSVVVRAPSIAAEARAAGANTAIALSDIAGQLLAESAFLPMAAKRSE